MINIVEEPLIFIRENQSSIHIIYDNYSIDYLHHKELSKFIQLDINELDISIYSKNRLFNLPYNN